MVDFSNKNSQNFTTELKLAPQQIREIEIAVKTAANFGLAYMADASVSVTLLDERGIIVAKSLAGSSSSKEMFRSFF